MARYVPHTHCGQPAGGRSVLIPMRNGERVPSGTPRNLLYGAMPAPKPEPGACERAEAHLARVNLARDCRYHARQLCFGARQGNYRDWAIAGEELASAIRSL